MSKLERLARRLVMLFALAAGCGTAPDGTATDEPAGTTPGPYATTPAQLSAAVQDDLTALRSLSVMRVDGLVLSQQAQAASCYSLPCELTDADPVITEYRRQAPRLTRLIDATRTAAGARELPAVTGAQTVEDLAALDALKIVSLSGLATVAPVNNLNCYTTPCQEDRAAAAAENQRRAGVAHVLAAEIAARPF